MADGEYTLFDALSDIATGAYENNTAKVEQASAWVGTQVRDLEAKAEVATMIVRVAVTEVRPGDALVFTLRDAAGLDYDGYLHYLNALKQLVARELGHPVPVLLVDGADVSVVRTVQDGCPSVYTGPQGRLECDRPRGHGKFGHMATIRHADGEGAIGWDDAEQDGARCPVTAPKPCVLEIRHPGNHRATDAGDPWVTATAQIQENESRSLFSTGGAGQPAPEHLSEGRLPKRDLATGELLEQECQASTLVPDGPDIPCARQRWHTGPHMDRTAIAHAGKAGEVWQ